MARRCCFRCLPTGIVIRLLAQMIWSPLFFILFFLVKNWKFYRKPFASRELRLHFDDSCQLLGKKRGGIIMPYDMRLNAVDLFSLPPENRKSPT